MAIGIESYRTRTTELGYWVRTRAIGIGSYRARTTELGLLG